MELALNNGIDFDLPTTIIWEGVTNYLEEDAIDKTFEFMRKFTNGYIIFTYINKEVLDDPTSFQILINIYQYLKRMKKNGHLVLTLKNFEIILINMIYL